MFEFWREATAASVPGFLCQSGRRRPEKVSILSSLITQGREPDKHHDFRNICPCRVGFHPMANLLFQEPNPGYS